MKVVFHDCYTYSDLLEPYVKNFLEREDVNNSMHRGQARAILHMTSDDRMVRIWCSDDDTVNVSVGVY